MAEKGALDLDAPIQKYRPAYPAKRWPVTARLLLAHLGAFGCTIEGASGTSYANLVRQHIFAPAGMINTFPDDARKPSPSGTAYFSKGLLYKVTGKFARSTSAQSIDLSDRLPAGGLLSTVDDMMRLAIALQYGKLVKDSTRELMWTRQETSDGKPLQFYGLGWLVGQPDSLRPKRVWNDGSQPGTRTFLYVRPTQGIIIALMTNMEGAACEDWFPRSSRRSVAITCRDA